MLLFPDARGALGLGLGPRLWLWILALGSGLWLWLLSSGSGLSGRWVSRGFPKNLLGCCLSWGLGFPRISSKLAWVWALLVDGFSEDFLGIGMDLDSESWGLGFLSFQRICTSLCLGALGRLGSQGCPQNLLSLSRLSFYLKVMFAMLSTQDIF